MAIPVDRLLSKAKSAARKGDLASAEQIYRSVLQRFPKNKRAIDGIKALKHHNPEPAQTAIQPTQNQINTLISLLNQGQLTKVIQHATALARMFPNAIAPYDFLGIAHMGLQNYEDCIACYAKALQIKPDFAEAHNNLGAALKALGRLNEAIASYKNALRHRPDYAEAQNNLGIAQQETGLFADAIASFEAALKIAPDYADAYFNLGSAQKEIGALPASIASFKKGLQIHPDNAEAHNHLGNAFQEYGRLDEAVISYQNALKVDPGFARTHLNLGSIAKAQGRLGDAVENYKAALRLKPDYAEAYRNYTAASKFQSEDTYTLQMADLLNSSTLTENDRMHLNFALGKVKLDLGQAAKGIHYLKAGNALRKQELNYDISIDEHLFKDIKDLFSAKKSVVLNISEGQNTSPTPIFILGMPRSGTSLVEQIISSHSCVHGAGELKYLGQIMDTINLDNGALSSNTIKSIRTEYYDRLADLNTDKQFVTDKMPANFRWIGFIAQAFPEAKIIHTKRTPAAVCWSNFKLYFPAGGMRYSFDMEDVARYYGMYQNLMKFWHNLFPNRIYDISYEHLTENQLEETQKLMTAIGLNWEDHVLDFHKNTRSVATASNLQVRRKMYKGSSQEWEKYKDYLAPMLEILNSLPKDRN
jgi:tetratricopeptide (TPR) repeat protein